MSESWILSILAMSNLFALLLLTVQSARQVRIEQERQRGARRLEAERRAYRLSVAESLSLLSRSTSRIDQHFRRDEAIDNARANTVG